MRIFLLLSRELITLREWLLISLMHRWRIKKKDVKRKEEKDEKEKKKWEEKGKSSQP